ncbi:MAG: RND transporter [Oleiphilus sp.]|nr:MAG: RND transporter [Oleiphilus sp.]
MKNVDLFSILFAKHVLSLKGWCILVAAIICFGIGSGARFLEFSSNYRIFFSDENPELRAFEDIQNTYTNNDNFLFVIELSKDKIFSSEVLHQVEWLTEKAWTIPYASRVDSITNFQHTYADEDGLVVEDLVFDARSLSSSVLADKLAYAMNEPLLVNQLISSDQNALAVNVKLRFPGESMFEVPEAVEKARTLVSEFESNVEGSKVYLTGVSMLNNAFSEVAFKDLGTLIPMMFGLILLLTYLLIRSWSGTLGVVIVIMFASSVAMGAAGFWGIKLSPISAVAPTVIMTLAVADSIHILVTIRNLMLEGMSKVEAIIESIRINFLPITITSLTTIVGFLALNFSDSPPFWHLGNMAAVGIAAAWLLSLTVLPVLVSLFPFSARRSSIDTLINRLINEVSDTVVKYPRRVLLSSALLSISLIYFIPATELNDQWVKYFGEDVQFRSDSDSALKYFGMYPVEFSVPARESGGVSEPEYMQNLDKFAKYLRAQEEVVHVYSIADIMKRLNKNLHDDNTDFYQVPLDRDQAAQYLLLYEMSLPYGLDLNDRLTIDKSASRVTAILGDATTTETRAFLEKTQAWMQANFPDYMKEVKPTSAQVMFTYIAERNIVNMISGTLLAVGLIAIIMMIALRSFSLGLLSLIPNGLPILVAFGTWALLIGEVGFSVSTVASISLGIIVDDTVHFLSKYMVARQERGLSSTEAVLYSFKNVGLAILVNTAVLAIGFLLLTFSTFKTNADMGLFTAIAISFALILDFLLLPALLILMDRKESHQEFLGHQDASSLG